MEFKAPVSITILRAPRYSEDSQAYRWSTLLKDSSMKILLNTHLCSNHLRELQPSNTKSIFAKLCLKTKEEAISSEFTQQEVVKCMIHSSSTLDHTIRFCKKYSIVMKFSKTTASLPLWPMGNNLLVLKSSWDMRWSYLQAHMNSTRKWIRINPPSKTRTRKDKFNLHQIKIEKSHLVSPEATKLKNNNQVPNNILKVIRDP